jgi:hypothetical protein
LSFGPAGDGRNDRNIKTWDFHGACAHMDMKAHQDWPGRVSIGQYAISMTDFASPFYNFN